MSVHDPIAYTYDADTHCPWCTEQRFGRCPEGFIACPDTPNGALDSECNPVGVIAPWDEWYEPGEPLPQSLVCGTCYAIIETIED